MRTKSLVALYAVLTFVNAAPIQEGNSTGYALEKRDYGHDHRNFEQIIRTLQNGRSRIGVTFSSMMNVGINYPSTLEINPEDLVLLPRGYCFSCDTLPGSELNKVTNPNQLQNTMAELNETDIILICANSDEVRGFEWPLVLRCLEQERIFREYLIGLRSHGNRVAVPKERLEEAPILRYNAYKCMPQGGSKTACDPISKDAKLPPGLNYPTITAPAGKRHSTITSNTDSTAVPWEEQQKGLESALQPSDMKGYNTWGHHPKVTTITEVPNSRKTETRSHKITSTHPAVVQSTSIQDTNSQSAATEPTITQDQSFPAGIMQVVSPQNSNLVSMVTPATGFAPERPSPSIDLMAMIASLQAKVDYLETKSPNLLILSPAPALSSPAKLPTTESQPACGDLYIAQDNETCEYVAAGFLLSVDEFVKLNPRLGQNCENFKTGERYCIGVRSL